MKAVKRYTAQHITSMLFNPRLEFTCTLLNGRLGNRLIVTKPPRATLIRTLKLQKLDTINVILWKRWRFFNKSYNKLPQYHKVNAANNICLVVTKSIQDTSRSSMWCTVIVGILFFEQVRVGEIRVTHSRTCQDLGLLHLYGCLASRVFKKAFRFFRGSHLGTDPRPYKTLHNTHSC